MKPRNWRTYSGWYKPPSFRIAKPEQHIGEHPEIAYVAWLCEARGWDREQAGKHIAAMDKRQLIGIAVDKSIPEPVIAKPAKAKPVSNVVPMRAPEPVRVRGLADRRADAAALLRELAGSYGPKRAHKMRAMADFIETEATRKVGAA